jgi:hypothetical protein
MTNNPTTDKYQRYPKTITQDLINAFIREASMQGKPLWLFTLHLGMGRSKDWRFSTFENTYKATDAFIQLANSYLLNKKSPAEKYLPTHVVIERSERHKWHSHLLVQQCIYDHTFHNRQLGKLMAVVNNPGYVVETRDGRCYPGSRGIGYDNAQSCYFHAVPVVDVVDISAYLTKWEGAKHYPLNSRCLT